MNEDMAQLIALTLVNVVLGGLLVAAALLDGAVW